MNYESVIAAVELHRPVGYDKYAYITTDPDQVKQHRCGECQKAVSADGCRTWKTANAD